MSSVREIRKTVLPNDIFKMIEAYMHGDIVALHIIAVTKDQKVIRTSAGDIPEYISANDTNFGT